MLFLSLAIVSIMSCGTDEATCETCTIDLLGVTTTVEVCEEGDDLEVTTNGVSQTITGQSLDTYVGTLEIGGYACE